MEMSSSDLQRAWFEVPNSFVAAQTNCAEHSLRTSQVHCQPFREPLGRSDASGQAMDRARLWDAGPTWANMQRMCDDVLPGCNAGIEESRSRKRDCYRKQMAQGTLQLPRYAKEPSKLLPMLIPRSLSRRCEACEHDTASDTDHSNALGAAFLDSPDNWEQILS